jgi:hypothetical protein
MRRRQQVQEASSSDRMTCERGRTAPAGTVTVPAGVAADDTGAEQRQ